ncbi:MAG: iron ABC transporter permease, partial [Gemmatimonadales bacterium]|nr:iron ABC transporter permease [Gemmatimonadales bacterium]
MARGAGLAGTAGRPQRALPPRGRRPLQSPRTPRGRGGASHGPLPARAALTHTPRRLALLALVVVAAGALSVSFGASGLGPADLWRFLLGEADPTTRSILLQLRLPRAVLAALVGGALGLCGCTFQALLRNPLAEPYVLGVSGGAAVGAVAVVVTGIGLRLPWTLPLGAFAGALAAMALVLAVARRASPGRMDTRVLILSGVIIGAFFNAVILLLLSLADVESFRSAIFWMMGNLSGADWGSTGLLALLLVPGALAVFSLARAFNLLSRGEEVAFHLGASVHRVK